MTTRWESIERLSNREQPPLLASGLQVWWMLRRLTKQKQQVGPGEVFGAIVTIELTQQLGHNANDYSQLSPTLTKAVTELISHSFEPKGFTISQLSLCVIDVPYDNQRLISAHFYIA